MQNTVHSIKLGILEDATGVGGPFEAVSVRPFLASFEPDEGSLYADFDANKATFAGSAAKVITWSAAMDSPDNNPFKESQLLLWICTADPATPEEIGGVFYYNGTDLIGWDLLPSTVRVEEQYDQVQHIATVP